MSEAQAPIANITAFPVVVPVVLPIVGISGRITNVLIRGVDVSGWLEEDGEGGWGLKAAYSKKGYLLLQDAYMEEDNPDGWALYRRYLKDWREGTTTRSFPLHLLPKKVQECQRGGAATVAKDPWNLPTPKPTTGAAADGALKK